LCYIEREQNKKFKCSVVVLRVRRVIVKLTKRLVALLLALMLVVGIFAVTALAYVCPYCGKDSYYRVDREGNPETYSTARVEMCGNYSSPHVHYNTRTPRYCSCDYCHMSFTVYKYAYGICPYA
jgi:hypothetical protein